MPDEHPFPQQQTRYNSSDVCVTLLWGKSPRKQLCGCVEVRSKHVLINDSHACMQVVQ